MRSDPPSSGQPTVVVSVVDLASLPPPPPTTDGPPELEQLSTFEPSRNRFRFDALLGEGGTGRVYAVFDEDLEREVAVKVVPRSGTSAEEAFAREARVTSSLSHPNVPPVFDVGRVAQGYYLTLPRIRGRSLRALIDEARERGEPSALPTSELVEVFLKVCDALAYAHDHGVVHQDIKPANIMIGNYGEVMLVDWGAASVVGQRHGDRPVTGTPAYMAPEQARGVTENPTLDVYALGATLFHSLLLRKPLVEKDPARFWQRKDSGELDFPTRQELSSYPRALLAIARRAMSARPVDRYASVPELAQALRDFASGGRSWSAPLVYETFTDEGWREHWRPLPEDAFVTAGGQLITRAPHAALLYFDERLSGGVAIEYEATLCADGPAGDVSVVW
ncbi:MAG TPA: serine/threonine-protein kinase, partial [Polyangiaceae bacterium]|nr:serine/threonine-protein kinase [Polyangiaceae bacterium]